MKIRKVAVHPRKRQIEMVSGSGNQYPLPFVRMSPSPSAKDPIERIYVDPELAREGVTYVLASGREGSVLLDQALDYNSDPAYVASLLAYRLTLDACDMKKSAGLSVREIARRLGTSVPQVYRLLDPTNTTKNLGQLVSLLQVFGCEVDFVVRRRGRRKRAESRSRADKAA